MSTRTIAEESELPQLARDILETVSKKDTACVVTLHGDLGAGKTAFTKALACELGVLEHVTSPTFVIMKTYGLVKHPIFKTLVHIDAYRIEASDEMRVLGFSELLKNPENIICIEWPERIKDVLSNDVLAVQIEIGKKGERTITY